MTASRQYFVNMIRSLRNYEEVVLYENILATTREEEMETAAFLADEYRRESLSYPFAAPPFDTAAATWGAKTIYLAAQLLLYRKNEETELEGLFPAFDKPVSPAAMLSADLCLRFLPDMLLQLKAIDGEDHLIGILEALLMQWHYSGIRYPLPAEQLEFAFPLTDPCLSRLYTDRVIRYKNLKLARHPAVRELVSASLGDLGAIYWNEFKLEMTIHE